MKLYPAIKNQNMKYPALANALLNVGMLLVIAAGFGLIYAAVWAPAYAAVATASVMGLVVGAVAVGISGRIAKVCNVSVINAPSALRRVK